MADDKAIEALLKWAESDDEESTPATPAAADTALEPPKENATIKAMRDALKRQERELKKSTSELEELRKFREEAVARERAQALATAGLSPRQSEVFLAAYGEVTPEAVAAFKSEVLGVTSEGVTEAPFAPTGFVGEPQQETLDRKGFEELFRKDPAKARDLFAQGKVKFRGM